jgi:hypothetical protein
MATLQPSITLKGGDRMARKYPKWIIAIALLVGGGTATTASTALANSSCITQPATVTVVENSTSNSTSTTHVHIVVKKTVRQQIKQFEKAHNVIVAINQHAKPIRSSKHCKDPVKMGIIKPGQPFTNTRKDGSSFTDSWQAGRKICAFRIIHRGRKSIAKGTKDNCGNRGIEIVIHGPKPKRQTKQVVEFRTVREFRTVYDKWITVTNNSSSNSSDTVSMQYTCAPGWTLIEGGLCRKCPVPQASPPKPKVTCLTHHDVFSGGQIDLEIKASFADGTQPTLTPDDVQFWADEGNMMDGTKHTYTDSSGTYWVQRWQAPATTITHVASWHASVRGAEAPCSNDNNVVADSGW